jgi:hypothetical protein
MDIPVFFIGLFSFLAGNLFHKAFLADPQIKTLKAVLSMKNAPEAPCETCKWICHGDCKCGCHQARVEWFIKNSERVLK